ncbi:TPA: Dot/Icm T4SS effector Ceg15 [Legionella pneumophila]|nr:Dot/Icm T4SS effector Ceg15 [Legionella pneumophila]
MKFRFLNIKLSILQYNIILKAIIKLKVARLMTNCKIGSTLLLRPIQGYSCFNFFISAFILTLFYIPLTSGTCWAKTSVNHNEVVMRGKREFLKHEYSPGHWSIDYTRAGTSIAVITVRNKYHYSVILNPTDCRGYRIIIRYLNEGDSSLSSAFNRPYTVSEQRGLNDVASLMTQVYEKLGLIVQFSQLGNNSQSFDKETGVTLIGSEEEPSMLHLHMWGRGDPDMEYIAGVPLRGPEPGLMFDLIAKNKTHPINQHAIKWNEEELKACLAMFKLKLAEYVNSPEFTEEFGDTLKVTIHDKKDLGEEKESGFGFFHKMKSASDGITTLEKTLALEDNKINPFV